MALAAYLETRSIWPLISPLKQGANREMAGYADPPKEHQFKPGQSGNPAGVPKGTKWMKTRLRELLEAGGLGDKVLDALIRKAQDGDVQAIREILDRIDGKVTQEVEQKTTIQDNRIDESKLTDEDIRVLADIQRRLGIGPETL